MCDFFGVLYQFEDAGGPSLPIQDINYITLKVHFNKKGIELKLEVKNSFVE